MIIVFLGMPNTLLLLCTWVLLIFDVSTEVLNLCIGMQRVFIKIIMSEHHARTYMLGGQWLSKSDLQNDIALYADDLCDKPERAL